MSISSSRATSRSGAGHRFAANGAGHSASATDQDLVDELLVENADLRAKLASTPTIEQAKGILMCHYRVDAEAASMLLRRMSSHTDATLNAIGSALVEAAAQASVSVGPAARGELEELLAAALPIGQLDAARGLGRAAGRQHERSPVSGVGG